MTIPKHIANPMYLSTNKKMQKTSHILTAKRAKLVWGNKDFFVILQSKNPKSQ
jgi:hypothetical protein